MRCPVKPLLLSVFAALLLCSPAPASARVQGRCLCKEGHFGRTGDANPKRVWWFYTASLDGARSQLMSPYLSSEAHCREAAQEHVDSGFCATVEVRPLGSR